MKRIIQNYYTKTSHPSSTSPLHTPEGGRKMVPTLRTDHKDTPTRNICNTKTLYMLSLQLSLTTILVVAVLFYQGKTAGLLLTRKRFMLLPQHLQSAYTDRKAPNRDDGELQRRFVEDAESRIWKEYHHDKASLLTNTTNKLEAVPLADFCGDRLRKSRATYTVFTDAVLAERKLFLSAKLLNCSEIPQRISLNTPYNHGRSSTPTIDVMVVPGSESFEKFNPHLTCHERVYEPSVMFSFINWPQYGHAMFNGVSLLWQLFTQGPLKDAGKNVRLYAYGDSIDTGKRAKAQESLPWFELGSLEPLRGLFTNQPVRSLANLLLHSERHPVCFAYVVAGLAGSDLDHYNFHAPLSTWRDFSKSVKAHFGVPDLPRSTEMRPLVRLVPADVIHNTDLDGELGPIPAIRWDDLADSRRPRLTILDRKGNRVIMNVKELERVAVKSGLFRDVSVVYAEEMHVGDQVRLMSDTDVLFGMDGTGLMNGIFMAEGGVVVHVRPYGCAEFLPGKGLNFDRMWSASPGRVIRHESGDRNNTRFPDNIPETADVAFNHSTPNGQRFSFILKQDTFIDPSAFRCILESAHGLLHGVAVNWTSHFACTRSVFV